MHWLVGNDQKSFAYQHAKLPRLTAAAIREVTKITTLSISKAAFKKKSKSFIIQIKFPEMS